MDVETMGAWRLLDRLEIEDDIHRLVAPPNSSSEIRSAVFDSKSGWLRTILMSGEAEVEYRFADYRELTNAGTMLPYRVEVWIGGTLVELIQFQEIQLGVEIEREVFDKTH